MAIDRLYKIAETGEIEKENPVNNVLKKSDEKSWLDSIKDFAGSTLGRNLIGGLGTALAVKLSGGDGSDALSYGLIGAGKTMNTINKLKEYENEQNRKMLDRQDKLAEAQAQRDFEQNLQNQRLDAEKAAADLEFQRRLQELDKLNSFDLGKLNLQNQFDTNRDLRQRGYALEDYQTKRADTLSDDLRNRGYVVEDRTADQTFRTNERLGTQAYTSAENALSRDNQRRLAEQQNEYDRQNYEVKRQDDLNDMLRQEALKRELSEQSIKAERQNLQDRFAFENQKQENQFQSDRELLNAKIQADAEAAKIDRENKIADREAEVELAERKAQATEQGKRNVDKQQSQDLKEKLAPQIVETGKELLNSFDNPWVSGIGPFGGRGPTTVKGGENRAILQDFRILMNQYIRSRLKEVGVGSKEMDGASEQLAYRYNLNKEIPANEIKATVKRIVSDTESGKLNEYIVDVANRYRNNTLPQSKTSLEQMDNDAWGGI